MVVRSSLVIAALGLALVNCASQNAEMPLVADPEGLLTGTVTHRERSALPLDAVVELWVIDVSPMFVTQAVLGEASVPTGGRQVPIPFTLRYDPKRIAPDHDYALKAAIQSGGRTLFQSEVEQRVITKGNPTRVDLVVGRVAGEPGDTTDALQGSAWRLENLGGTGAVDRVEATLEFPEAGKVAGSGSCNRFFGTVATFGDSIQISPLGTTRMMCPEAVMNQETKYLAALQNAERFALDRSILLIYYRGAATPLRFVRK